MRSVIPSASGTSPPRIAKDLGLSRRKTPVITIPTPSRQRPAKSEKISRLKTVSLKVSFMIFSLFSLCFQRSAKKAMMAANVIPTIGTIEMMTSATCEISFSIMKVPFVLCIAQKLLSLFIILDTDFFEKLQFHRLFLFRGFQQKLFSLTIRRMK